MNNLDNIKVIEAIDRHGMSKLIESFPGQCQDAKEIGLRFNVPAGLKRQYKNLVLTGLGGSAIGGDILRSYVSGEAGMPIFVNRNYTLPQFVDSDSLVVVSSYSGNTEETISAYKDARDKLARILVVTSGGEIQKLAEADGNPVIKIPPGLPPRCALGYSFFPLLIVLSKIGLIRDKSKEIDEVIGSLRDINKTMTGQDVPVKNNIAKTIAGNIHNKFPIIYGGQDHIDSIVTRWRGQLAENAKTLSSGYVFPEINHNEIVGWDNPAKLIRDFMVVILRDSGDHPRISRRMDITKGIIEKQGVKVIEVKSIGSDLLPRIFSLIYIGDSVSFYLAILNKVDPTPVDRIAYFKEELAKN
jgi:glucose/mannose-6-phosphate isomerase